MTINFNGKQIEYRFNFRADMIYENVMNKSFKGETETEWIVFFWCNYLSLTNDYDMTLDEFIDILDKDTVPLWEFISFYTKTMVNQNKLIPNEDETGKKKVRTKKTKTKK